MGKMLRLGKVGENENLKVRDRFKIRKKIKDYCKIGKNVKIREGR